MDAENTKSLTLTAVKTFREYLNEKQLSSEFENFDKQQLDERLANFYIEMRNKDGQMYKKSTLTWYSEASLEDSQLLQYKVFLDIMLHFGRRGRENLARLKRSDFAVTQDAGNFLYVYQTKDEQTKNHQDDSEKCSAGRMYEIKGMPNFPNQTE